MAMNKQILGLAMTCAVCVVLWQLIPVIGETTSGITTFGAASQWNESVNTDLPTAPDLWETIGGVAELALILGGIGVALAALMKVSGKNI